MEHFILQFRLKTECFQEDILAKRFEIGRKIYNSLVNITQKRYRNKRISFVDFFSKVVLNTFEYLEK